MKTTFLMVARLLYDKGYSEYVEAAKIIKNENSETEFLLLGGIATGYPNHVPKEVVDHDNEKGYISYLGFKSDVVSVVREADCIVLPSFYYEGLSRTLMEALALGKPIITTDIPGCRETVENGINGFLIKPKSADSLSEAIRKFLGLSEQDRELMSRRSRQKAEEEFDVRNVISVYKSITNPRLNKNV